MRCESRGVITLSSPCHRPVMVLSSWAESNDWYASANNKRYLLDYQVLWQAFCPLRWVITIIVTNDMYVQYAVNKCYKYVCLHWRTSRSWFNSDDKACHSLKAKLSSSTLQILLKYRVQNSQLLLVQCRYIRVFLNIMILKPFNRGIEVFHIEANNAQGQFHIEA